MRYVLWTAVFTVSLASVLLAQATREDPATRPAGPNSAGHLRAIGRVLLQYAHANRGYLPADLGQLVPKYAPAELFVRPNRTPKLEVPADLKGEALAGWINENSDFVYTRLQERIVRNRKPQETPVVVEKFSEGQASMAVLYLDGHVTEFVPAPATRPAGSP